MFYERYGVPPEKVHWAPLCVDNASWTAKIDALRPRRAELRAELGVDPDLPVVVYVAHMRPNKRPLDVAKALEKMRTPASLVMVGGGPLFDELAAYVHDRRLSRVHLLGSRNQSELPKLYAIADAFVLPSAPGEITPLVIHEAMCGALPLVISDAVPSTIDFVREGDNGFTYPMGDVDALADRLDRVLGDPARAAAMGARSRAIIAEWNYDVTVAGILGALRAIAPREAG
jgi:glycosyltransferase involved in cell wall biosynthesis